MLSHPQRLSTCFTARQAPPARARNTLVPRVGRRPFRRTAKAFAAAGAAPSASSDDPAEEKVSLETALREAQEALTFVEEFQGQVTSLPSARLPTTLDMVLAKLKPVFQVAGLVALCAAIHALGIPGRLVGGLTLALSAASWGLSRGSLDRSGAAAAVVVGWITIATSMTGGLLLLTFFVASSKLTALCDHEKELDDDHKPGGNRDWTQVLSNSAVPTALLAAAAALGTAPTLGPRHLAALHAAVLGYYACCCGDTWASEIGQLSDAQPRLPWGRPVRPGTNGGVTLLGTAASAAGGLFMGAMAAVGCLVRPGRAWGWAAPTGPLWGVLLMGLVAGVGGSFLDSILGATVQFTGYNRDTHKVTSQTGEHISFIAGRPWLSNSGVNVASACGTALACAAATLVWAV
ncbi:hypothetical protein ACKKBF_B03525 [Auxenochlorella protothecoides x Auxenochlorella symbiontica]